MRLTSISLLATLAGASRFNVTNFRTACSNNTNPDTCISHFKLAYYDHAGPEPCKVYWNNEDESECMKFGEEQFYSAHINAPDIDSAVLHAEYIFQFPGRPVKEHFGHHAVTGAANFSFPVSRNKKD